MSTRTQIIAVVVLTVVAAIVFGYRSFQRELASVRRRQDPQAVECRNRVDASRTLVEQARAAYDVRDDPCEAAELARSAVASMEDAREVCSKFFDKDVVLTTPASIARMRGYGRHMSALCDGSPPANGDSASGSVK